MSTLQQEIESILNQGKEPRLCYWRIVIPDGVEVYYDADIFEYMIMTQYPFRDRKHGYVIFSTPVTWSVAKILLRGCLIYLSHGIPVFEIGYFKEEVIHWDEYGAIPLSGLVDTMHKSWNRCKPKFQGIKKLLERGHAKKD